MPKRKQDLRDSTLRAIKQAGPVRLFLWSAVAQQRLHDTPEFQRARTVAAYHSDPTEVETHDLILTCLREGKRVGLPRMGSNLGEMDLLEVSDVKDLEKSKHGFKQPAHHRPHLALEEIDLLVVPGRAFDAKGGRLGRGGGYYDRLLARPELKARIAALAFELQLVAEVPRLPHDRAVDLIVTETRVIRK